MYTKVNVYSSKFQELKSVEKFTVQDYVELAKAVIAGYPEEQAQKILEAQRKLDETNVAEQQYWLAFSTLRGETSISKSTTIRVSTRTKKILEKMKTHSGESFDSVIQRLVDNQKVDPMEFKSQEEKLQEKIRKDKLRSQGLPYKNDSNEKTE
jgi:hypothetical protein